MPDEKKPAPAKKAELLEKPGAAAPRTNGKPPEADAAAAAKETPQAPPKPAAPAVKKKSPSRHRPEPRPIDWEKVTDEELLGKRICDLPIQIEGGELEGRIRSVYKDLDGRGIGFHPKVYLGDEWFSPEGDPIISIPYYLAQPRLMKLERNRVLEAEGDTRAWFMRLLRHEMGHALSHAYGLHKYKGYDKVFGASSRPYPKSFRPRPYSKRYVVHLEDWYAQIHPDEDFAETVAVWLTPGLDWRRKYAGWPALKKLEFVEQVMGKVRGKTPQKRTGPMWRRLSKIRMTIAQSHKIKRKELAEHFPDFFDRDLKAIFGEGTSGEKASKFLRRNRALLVRTISKWTREKRYTIHDLIKRFTERCEELKLRVSRTETETAARVAACLTAMAANYHQTGKFKRHL